LSGFRIQMANRSLAFVVSYEVVIGVALILFLRHRGWRFHHVTLPFAGRDVARGLGVWALTILSIWIVVVCLFVLTPGYLAEVMKTRMIGSRMPFRFWLTRMTPISGSPGMSTTTAPMRIRAV